MLYINIYPIHKLKKKKIKIQTIQMLHINTVHVQRETLQMFLLNIKLIEKH